jgi:hypothetical protein
MILGGPPVLPPWRWKIDDWSQTGARHSVGRWLTIEVSRNPTFTAPSARLKSFGAGSALDQSTAKHMKVATAALVIAFAAVPIRISPGQKINAPEPSTTNAIDRAASAQRNLQDVQKGISDENQLIKTKTGQVDDKRKQIEKLSKQGSLFEAKIQTLREEIREAEEAIGKAKSTREELHPKEQKYKDDLAKAERDIQRPIVKERAESPLTYKADRKEVQRRFVGKKQVPNHSSGGGTHTVSIYRVVYDDGTSAEVEQ